MKCLRLRGWAGRWMGLLLSCFVSAVARADTPLSANEVMRRAVERAESPRVHTSQPDYEYRKHTVTEEIDKNGRLKEHRERLYDVLVEAGLSYLKLIQLNGQNLSAAEQKKQEERDAAERAKLTDAKPGSGDNREILLTAELADKYKYTLQAQTQLGGRPAYVIAFEPRSDNLPVKKMTDRFANHIAGTVWIDAQDFEIAKVDIHLTCEISLWGGLIGVLKHCDFSLVRTRLPDGVWVTRFSHGVFEGRKLLEPVLIKTLSESSDFRRISLAGN